MSRLRYAKPIEYSIEGHHETIKSIAINIEFSKFECIIKEAQKYNFKLSRGTPLCSILGTDSCHNDGGCTMEQCMRYHRLLGIRLGGKVVDE